ncbi:MarR family winged helix-turn-helix transcriptional regulator [Brevundimonas sp. FT23028]|uniref:MarR family winged helix-turn-helix transcriptional regulator n=1 Tax=Brevundimonas sp. FT23028 TaxID=3393748 RepID=UPI003B58B2D6
MTEFRSEAEAAPTDTLVRSVRRIAQAVDVRSREIARLTGLTLPQLLVLQSIRAQGEVSSSAISRDVSMSPPTVVAVLDRLEARGMIVRYRSTTDRRVVHARLTEAGEDALKTSPGLLRADALTRWAELPLERRAALAEAMDLLSTLMAPSPDPTTGP